jgi:hypothetical protein
MFNRGLDPNPHKKAALKAAFCLYTLVIPLGPEFKYLNRPPERLSEDKIHNGNTTV